MNAGKDVDEKQKVESDEQHICIEPNCNNPVGKCGRCRGFGECPDHKCRGHCTVK